MRYIITVSWVSPSSIHNSEKSNKNTMGNGLFPWSPSHLLFLTASPSWHLECTCVHTCQCMLLWPWQSLHFLLSHVTDWAVVHSHRSLLWLMVSLIPSWVWVSGITMQLFWINCSLLLMSRRSLSSCDAVQTPRGKRENSEFGHHWKFSFWFFWKYIQGC